ncbi:MAG: peptidoglycan-binding protein, partial [Actinomycetota bacterium]|nr:peptidoglycan-binding protein [Actinomycetota bacterium]
PPPPPTARLRLPLGKGMWLHHLDQAGSATAVVNKAKAVGLTHLYLRVGSSKKGFYNQYGLDHLLPVAHAAGIKVVGWDFPYLFDPAADADRGAAAIAYTTPDGHRMDAFSADIETAAEGVNLTAEGALAYGARLRELVGPDYPLIATVPRPSPKRFFPFAEATASFDAIAPMVYWQNRDPATDAAQAMVDLAPFGKPVLLVGQAYDGGPEGGPAGPPPRDHLDRFMATGLAHGAAGVSFWVWHHATAEHWAAIRDAGAWRLTPGEPAGRGQATFLQRVLSVLGQPVTVDGLIGPETRTALATLQQSLGLPGSGVLDPPTLSSLFGPRY